jgi:hypothetical protein
VLLGIIPGAGGTQRLPRLCGVATAVELCTQGQHIGAKRALAEGILDQIVDGDLLAGAIAFALAKAAAGETRKVREQSAKIADPAAASAAMDAARASLKKTARGAHAPYAAVDAIASGVFKGFDAGSACEIELFADCVLSAESRNLIRLFFAEREAAKVPGVPKETPTAEIRAAAVVGAGTMGGGIAMNYANAGIPVLLKGIRPGGARPRPRHHPQELRNFRVQRQDDGGAGGSRHVPDPPHAHLRRFRPGGYRGGSRVREPGVEEVRVRRSRPRHASPIACWLPTLPRWISINSRNRAAGPPM